MLQSSAAGHGAVQRGGHRSFAVDHGFDSGAQLARLGRRGRQEIERALPFRHGLGAPRRGLLRGRLGGTSARDARLGLDARRHGRSRSRSGPGTAMPARPARGSAACARLSAAAAPPGACAHRLQLRGQRAIQRASRSCRQGVFGLAPAPRAAVLAISIPGTTIATGHVRFRYAARQVHRCNSCLAKCVSFID